MKIFVNGITKELSDNDILAIGVGTSPKVAALMNSLLKRAKRAEHKCEIWEKMAVSLYEKLKEKQN